MTSFTADSTIVIAASTNRLVAGPLPPGPLFPEVERLTATPPMVTTAAAFAVNVPAVSLLIVRVQVATLPTTVGAAQVLLCEVGAGLTLGVIEVNATGVAPDGIAVAVIVNTC